MSAVLQVKVADHRYPINFQADCGGTIAREVAAGYGEGRRGFLVTDEQIATAQAAFLAVAFGKMPSLALPAGEGTKSLTQLGVIWDFLAEHRADRRSVVWLVGGGVVGDLGGFAAATYLRGIDCVQVPTTLLAMVDSSVGGKTGLNLSAGKNLAGAFHHPTAVHICPAFLQTLPPREFAAGAAEVIKYGLLGDAALFSMLETQPLAPDRPQLTEIIRRCCALKAAVVESDPQETAAENGRALLNLGHTFGHAIERVAGYGAYLHGEAVAVGLCAAARLSRDLGLVNETEVARIDRCVAAHGLPTRLREPLPLAALLNAMANDKKNRGGALRFVVLETIGRAVTRGDVPAAAAEAVWRELGAV
ncbi:MAG: 3-dehydroquinate synthase [Opitutus sp.]|nr:3-dehydroquinate synthase [Opitutus sp.]